MSRASAPAEAPAPSAPAKQGTVERSGLKASYKVGLALIFCYLVAWLDRMMINMTIPFIADELHIGPDRIGWILSAFFLGYAIFQIPGGMLADRVGPRRVILAALTWWSAFTALTGAMFGLSSMLTARFLFGIGEGVFPASVWKVLGQWFSRKNRATANALVLSSIALGPALTPLIIAPMLQAFGWRTCFFVLGGLGVVCLALAGRYIKDSIRDDPTSTPAEIAEVEADAQRAAAGAKSPLREVLADRNVLVLFAIALIFNVTMYGWLNWLPSYLLKVKGLNLKGMALAGSLPFMFGTVGCMLSGYVSDRWFRGRRKLLAFGCQVVGGLCLFLFTRTNDFASYMAVQCIAGFLLFMACGAIWALPMVILPTRAMGAGSGFINTGGQIGGFLTNLLIGYAITWRGGDYSAGFSVILGALVLASALVILGIRERPATDR
jgi:sugar phosphate permease